MADISKINLPDNSSYDIKDATARSKLSVLTNNMATCTTGRATAAKVATLANFSLNVGASIAVKFTDTAGTDNPSSGNLTLNVNNTGAKVIGYCRNGGKAALIYKYGSYFYNNLIHIFTYDGTYWLCMDWNQDNNTWRGIQNNLTSDSTSDSLSAAQGKALKALVDGKAAASHSHTVSEISDFPASLPANGGNADSVDGFHASSIFCQRATPSSRDCNDCTEVGAYFFNGCLANAPTSNGVLGQGGYFILETVTNNVALVQTATFTHGTFQGQKFSRHLDKASNSWSAWEEIMKNKFASGLISGLSNGSAVTVSLKFAPVAVLFLDSTYIKPVSSGFSVSLGTSTFTITPSSVSAMGTTGVRYLAFGG
ncbi:MAG: hypothetical protein ACI4GX_04935 [Ruminococcus sp.]